jgi:hypothetical protein
MTEGNVARALAYCEAMNDKDAAAMAANSLVKRGKTCYVRAAFVALVTPLESIEGAARILAASFALRLEAVEK